MLGGAILFSMKHSSCDPYQVCVCGRQAVSFWCFVPSWNFVEGLVCLEPFSLLGVWHLYFWVYQWISHSWMYLLWISSKWWFIHLVSFLPLAFLCLLVSGFESLEHAYLLLVVSLACFLSLTQYIGGTPPSLKLDEMCMKFIFISICTYLCGVCHMYCWFANSLVPMSLGTILFVVLF